MVNYHLHGEIRTITRYFPFMGVVVGGFEFFLDVGSGVCRLLRSFTLGYAVVVCGLLCLTTTLVCAFSLSGDSCGLFFCLNVSDNFLVACNLLYPMYSNQAVGAEFVIASIKSSTAFSFYFA